MALTQRSTVPALLSLAGATAGAAALTAYATLNSRSQLFGRTLVAPAHRKQIALTFDDGPNPAATPRLLDLLARYRVRATFFLIGNYVLRQPGLTRQIAAAGHLIGNHTQSHLWLPRYPESRIFSELEACSHALEDVLGERVTLFRPPHGARRPAVLRAARSLQLETMMWNTMVGDWQDVPPAKILERLERKFKRNQRREEGTCIVLHDGSQHHPAADRTVTLEALEAFLARLPATARFVLPASAANAPPSLFPSSKFCDVH